MKKRTKKRQANDDLRPEYDLRKSKGKTRGKYGARYRSGTNPVLLPPDVAKHFPDQASVNAALRTLIRLAKTSSARRR